MSMTSQPLTIERMRTNGLIRPLAVQGRPAFSWVFAGPDGARPKAAIVELRDATGSLLWTKEWTPGTIPTVRYDGDPLPSSADFSWSAIVIDADGTSASSDVAGFATAPELDLPALGDWVGLPVREEVDQATRVQYLRTEFDLTSEPVRARLHVAALGWVAPW